MRLLFTQLARPGASHRLRMPMAVCVWLLTPLLVVTADFASAQSKAALAVAVGTSAESKPELPDTFSVDDIDSLVAPLTDTQIRQLLIDTMRKQATLQTASETPVNRELGFSTLLENIRAGSSNAIARMEALTETMPRIGAISEHAFTLLTDLQGWPRMGAGIANLILMIGAGVIAAVLLNRRLRGVLPHPDAILSVESSWNKLSALLIRASPKAVQIAVFAIVGHTLSLIFFQRFDPMRLFLISWFGAVAVGGGAHVVGGVLFAPGAAALRLPKLSDSSARMATMWLTAVVFVSVFAALNAGMLMLLAVPDVLVSIWQILAGVVVLTLTLVALHQCHSSGPDEPQVLTHPAKDRSRLSATNHLALIKTGVILLFVIWTGRTFAGEVREASAVVVAALALAAAWYARQINVTAPLKFASSEHIGTDKGKKTLLPVFLVSIAAIALVQALLVDLVALAETPMGKDIVASLVQIGFTLLVAAVVWTLMSRTIARFIERERAKAIEEMGETSGDNEGGSGIVESRLGTLLPLFRGFALTVIAIITFMIVLSSFGVHIGPLLAGAGVVGIALGFGAQALVRDIISGVFFLIDDAFRVGEYIEFGEYRGEVERISIRSMRLRHHRGAIQTIPFGELLVVVNHNRDWVIYKQEFQVPYEADIEKIRKIIKRIGQELLEDPVHGPNFLAPLKSQGVRRVENGVLVISTKFTCKPREQFLLRRAVYQRVRDELYANGIELAHRRVQIEIPEHIQQPSSDAAQIVTAAAEAAIEDELAKETRQV